MTYSELAHFIEHEMKMEQVYQPVMLGLMLESEAGVVTEAEAVAAFGAVLDDDREYDVRRYPGDVLVNHNVIERLQDGSSYRLIGFEGLTDRERAVLVKLCDARIQVYLEGGDPTLEVGQLGRVYGEIQGYNEGACFPNRQELHDSGIHRPLQAGICGSASDGGAESIVVSGGYEDDRDYGDEIIYTGSGGNEGGRQIANQTLTLHNKALATNITSGNPVRVIRGENGDVTHSPPSGFRYDGLYYVHDYGFRPGQSGYRIVWFKLVKGPDSGGNRDLKGTSVGKKKPDRRWVTTLRTVRDTKVSKEVKRLHRYRCQICGESLETPAGPYAEAAHIQPLGKPHDGPDVPDNILCLCPNDHVLFDKGAVHVLDDLTVVRPGSSSSKLQTVRGHQVDITYLAYHRKNFGIE